ncbi:hypothetical protein [Aquiflexum gelatinilyticum]|uniref:Uncharacterized protein n=1 Tax=Aquiflexum gelatinilyticum TaxID=2961943 RepID=A0A9X2SZL2_9BACT|nr:hypothetical protein [Aquiflexum gelatinilyticum]MCR9014628.1 hypothetical protein [Aquiflexum gelatinilyticum]
MNGLKEMHSLMNTPLTTRKLDNHYNNYNNYKNNNHYNNYNSQSSTLPKILYPSSNLSSSQRHFFILNSSIFISTRKFPFFPPENLILENRTSLEPDNLENSRTITTIITITTPHLPFLRVGAKPYQSSTKVVAE